MEKSLLLDCNFMAVSIVSWKKALLLIIRGKAEAVGGCKTKAVRSNINIDVPSILKLKYSIPYNCYSTRIKFTKRNTLLRDGHKCQYCGIQLGRNAETIDHIMPSSRGGKTDYINCVACCKACNNKKRDRTPAEAGMTLLSRPRTPNFLILCHNDERIPKEWSYFITGVYNHEDRV